MDIDKYNKPGGDFNVFKRLKALSYNDIEVLRAYLGKKDEKYSGYIKESTFRKGLGKLYVKFSEEEIQ